MRKPRRCYNCGRSYNRCNTIWVWTDRNPGKRYGWVKQLSKFCMKCQSVEESREVVKLVDVKFVRIETKEVKHDSKKGSGKLRVAA